MLSFVMQECFQGEIYPLRMSYGERLKEAIKLAGSSRKALGVDLGITEQAIGMVVRGDTNALTATASAR